MTEKRQWICNGCHAMVEGSSLPSSWATISMEVPSTDQWGTLKGGSEHVGLTLCRGCYITTFKSALRVIRAKSDKLSAS